MVKKIILQSFIWLIIIGCISYAVAFILGDPTPTILTEKTINYGNGVTVTMYQLNIHAYLTNIQNSINIPFKDMYIKIPEPYTFKIVGATVPEQILNVLKSFPNSYIFFINYIMWIANILIVIPTKLLIHPIVLTLTLLGINTTNLGIVKIANTIYTFKFDLMSYI